ncbi:MAG: DUF4249 family protein [Balneolales bacterium]
MATKGCDLYEIEEYEGEVFVYSQMTAMDPLPRVELLMTSPHGEDFAPNKMFDGEADVTVYLLDQQGGREAEYNYHNSREGRYTYPQENGNMARPLRTYELVVKLPESGKVISSFTTVPDTFRVVHTVRDTVTFMQADPLEYHLTESAYPGRQAHYMLATKSLDAENHGLTPKYESSDLFRPGFTHIRSEITNQAAFKNQSSLIMVPYPWDNIAHYGPNQLLFHAIDDNMYDFYRTLDHQTGSQNLAPGEIRGIKYNTKGGPGLFGSMATATANAYIYKATKD